MSAVAVIALAFVLLSPPRARAGGVAPPAGFADLAARLLPAVVNIAVSEQVKPGTPDADDPDDGPNGDAGPDGSGNGQLPFPPGSPFDRFFRDYMNRQRPDPDAPGTGRRIHALGSGFIIDPAGIIVTNNHVIDGADRITVTLQDNTELKATVVGHDATTDLAVLKVTPAHPLPAVPFGDSDHMRVGDLVMAIGNPFGLSGTVTTGIVSSRGRDIHRGQYDDFIQTDAPINRGNSGGPLFDMQGEVIGVNTAIYTSGGGSIGIGFAIPSDEVRLVTAQLLKYGHTRRGWIGVRVQDLTPELARTMQIKAAGGALLSGVDAKGPAHKAGLKVGDVVLTYDGKPVDGRSLPRLVSDTPVGQAGTFGLWRDGRTLTVGLVIEDYPQPPASPGKTAGARPGTPVLPRSGAIKPPPTVAPAPGANGPGNGTLLGATGLRYAALDPQVRDAAHLDPAQSGVAITDVAPDSPADEHGLASGDVILKVDQTETGSPDRFAAAIAAARKAGRASVLLLVQNADGQEFVPLPLGS